jgi:hypothetical protein
MLTAFVAHMCHFPATHGDCTYYYYILLVVCSRQLDNKLSIMGYPVAPRALCSRTG